MVAPHAVKVIVAGHTGAMIKSTNTNNQYAGGPDGFNQTEDRIAQATRPPSTVFDGGHTALQARLSRPGEVSLERG